MAVINWAFSPASSASKASYWIDLAPKGQIISPQWTRLGYRTTLQINRPEGADYFNPMALLPAVRFILKGKDLLGFPYFFLLVLFILRGLTCPFRA